VRWGTEFKKPSKKALRTCRKRNGARMFEPAELHSLLAAASVPMRAMILLGVNCGFGNGDIFRLPIKALDLKGSWVEFARPKTGIDRRCPLWPETVAACKEALAKRPEPSEACHAGLVFLTKHGRPWGTRAVVHPDKEGDKLKRNMDDPVSKEFKKLLKRPRCPKCGTIETTAAEKCGACGWKPTDKEEWTSLYRLGLGFYALRHTFETIGGDSRDQVAVDALMGHARDDMASVYRERIDNARLQAVVDHVHKWLWPADESQEPIAEGSETR
jgi:integrase